MNKTYLLAIIGTGPAGLTAAIYAARANIIPLVFQGPKPGGQLMSTTYIENWPGNDSILGPSLMINMMNQAQKLATIMHPETITNLDLSQQPFKLTTNQKQDFYSHSIIIASGTTPNKLSCPGEDFYWGKGVSTCAVCDGAFYQNQSIVIVGSGDSSMESASFLLRNHNKITIVHIGDKLTASFSMQQRIKQKPNITIISNSTVTSVLGDEKKITHVEITHLKTGQKTMIMTSALFLAIGHKPNTDLCKGQLELTPSAHIKVYDQVKTSKEGVFAAGDVQDAKYRQAIVSAGFGCIAALEAERYLNEKNLL
ncbi:FAD-dependent oxidoreductase [Candidatus Dependentiae bacterium]|nr:FAD-dependent oxidoreductase [Candidatus Dependentiae bacterium]